MGLPQNDFAVYGNQLEAIKKLRSCPETIDLILTSQDGGTEPVHSYYLALRAPSLWQRISGLLETLDRSSQASFKQVRTSENINLSVARVEVAHIDARLLHILVSVMYGDEVVLDYDLCWQLLPIAFQFKLPFLAERCFHLLQSSFTIANCVCLLQTGLKFSHRLSLHAYRFVLRHFAEIVIETKVLGQLSVHQLSTILQDNNLQVSNEYFAWLAIYNWIEVDSPQRIQHFWPLFCLVRWQLVHSTFLNQYILPEFCNLNLRNDSLLVDKKGFKNFNFPLNIFNPRVPRHVVFVYGGYENGLPSSTFKVFDIRCGMWFRMDINESEARVHHTMVRLGKKLYIMGGSDGLDILNSVRCFNPVTRRFRERQPMIQARCYHCAVRFGNSIVVMGGNNGTDRLRTCEQYDPVNDVWHSIASMSSARSDASATVLNNKIYIAGGVDMFGLSSVEFYSFESRHWTVVSSMSISRRSFSLVTYGNHLYAIGGCTDVTDYTCLQTVERMNSLTNQWKFVAPLTKARSSFISCVLEDKLFVFGGYNGYSTRKSSEVYDIRSNRWEQTPFHLPTELSGASVEVVSDLPNALHYTYYGQCAHQSSLPTSEYDSTLPIMASPARKHKQIARLMVRHSESARKRLNKAMHALLNKPNHF